LSFKSHLKIVFLYLSHDLPDGVDRIGAKLGLEVLVVTNLDSQPEKEEK
jgi:hypothetical protein